MSTFQALVADNKDHNADDPASIRCQWQEQPLIPPSDRQVQIRVHYSSVNYKDALALTGKGKILRQLPLTPGIDASGVVSHSRSKNFKEGDEVLVTGCGLGENINGGYGEVITVPEEWVIAKPRNLALKDCMILGTAGFTAGLALHQLEKNGLSSDQGPVLVTGATGGVGSLSLLILKNKHYVTEAWTRKLSSVDELKQLGADRVVDISKNHWTTRPLETAVWSAAIDNVGGEVLSYILPRIRPHGGVACIGLAKSHQLNTTVFPHILRGVNLLGISSATCPRPLREKIWQELNELDCDWSLSLTQELKKEDLFDYAQKMMTGQTQGRAIVVMNEQF